MLAVTSTIDVAHAIDGVVEIADWSKVVLAAVSVAGHVANLVGPDAKQLWM